MPVVPTIDASQLKAFNAKIRQIDPDLRKAFTKEIKGALTPAANEIKSGIPSQAPLSGMRDWKGGNVGVRASTAGKGPLAFLNAYGRGSGDRIFKIADLAGTKGTYTQGERGRQFNQSLQRRFPLSAGGRGGRFAWAGFIKSRPKTIDGAIKIIDKYSAMVSKKGL